MTTVVRDVNAILQHGVMTEIIRAWQMHISRTSMRIRTVRASPTGAPNWANRPGPRSSEQVSMRSRQARRPFHTTPTAPTRRCSSCSAAGRSLRTPDGWRELAEGEVVAFRVGEDGAHQLQNRGAQHARVLVVSRMIAPEVNLYLDTGKLVAATRAPGASDVGFQEAYRREQATDYWTDEEPPVS
jgi:hypothetical protein